MKQWAYKQKGFTIVELLIVVVVIAILAAITIVAYNGITNRAKLSSGQVAAAQAKKQLQILKVQSGDVLPVTLSAVQAAQGFSSLNVTRYLVDNTSSPNNFCITIQEGGRSFSATSVTTDSVEGVCVENLVPNPKSALAATQYSVRGATNNTVSGARVTSVSGLASLGISSAYRASLASGSNGTWWRVRNCASIPIESGARYTYSVSTRSSVNVGSAALFIWQGVSTEAATSSSNSAMEWNRIVVTANAPAGATSTCLEAGGTETQNASGGAYFDATALQLVKGDIVSEYHDGDSSGWFWTGTPNASTSIGPAKVDQ